MTANDLPEIDRLRLNELMAEYAKASTKEQERKIENDILRETVWQIDKTPFAAFSEEEWRYISENVESDDETAKGYLRSPFVHLLESNDKR